MCDLNLLLEACPPSPGVGVGAFGALFTLRPDHTLLCPPPAQLPLAPKPCPLTLTGEGVCLCMWGPHCCPLLVSLHLLAGGRPCPALPSFESTWNHRLEEGGQRDGRSRGQ